MLLFTVNDLIGSRLGVWEETSRTSRLDFLASRPVADKGRHLKR